MSEAILSGHIDDECPGCGTRLSDIPDDPVMLSRPQYEALMAAVSTVHQVHRLNLMSSMNGGAIDDVTSDCLAALRTVGIQIEGEGE